MTGPQRAFIVISLDGFKRGSISGAAAPGTSPHQSPHVSHSPGEFDNEVYSIFGS